MTVHLIFADNKLIFFSKAFIVDRPCPSMLWKACILCWFIRYFSTAFFFPVPCLYHIQILWISSNVWFLAFQNFLVFAVLLFCCFSRCPSRSWWAHTLTCFSLFQCFSAVLPCLDHILTMPWYTGTLTQWGRYISHYNYGCLSIHCNQECLMKSPIVHLGEFDESHYSLHFQLPRSCDTAGSSSKLKVVFFKLPVVVFPWQSQYGFWLERRQYFLREKRHLTKVLLFCDSLPLNKSQSS